MNCFFHRDFEHLEEKAFLKSYLININDGFVLGTILGLSTYFKKILNNTFPK